MHYVHTQSDGQYKLTVNSTINPEGLVLIEHLRSGTHTVGSLVVNQSYGEILPRTGIRNTTRNPSMFKNNTRAFPTLHELMWFNIIGLFTNH